MNVRGVVSKLRGHEGGERVVAYKPGEKVWV